jgi:sec-independent protein translocase protein TatC
MAVQAGNQEPEELAEGTLISHLVELRQRLVRAVLTIIVTFLCLLPFQARIFQLIAKPLQDILPAESEFIATGPIAPFMTPFKTTFFAALFIAMPVVLYQAWAFIAPGLYRREKRFATPLLVSSIVLFYVGVAFAYFVVFRMVFGFIIHAAPEIVRFSPDINQYLSFVLLIFLSFGLAFEIPIATFILIWSRLVSIETLKKNRPYVFLGCFVIAMFMTPPDAISQTLMALPMYALYEGGMIFAQIFLRDRMLADRQAAAEAQANDGNNA